MPIETTVIPQKEKATYPVDLDRVKLPSPVLSAYAVPGDAVASGNVSNVAVLSQTVQSSISMLYAGATTREAQKIKLTEYWISGVSFYLCVTGAPTGTVYIRIRRVSDDTIIAESSMLAGSLTTTYAWYDFYFANTVQIDEDCRYCAEFSGGSSTDYVEVGYNNVDTVDGVESYYDTTGWNEAPSNDCTIKIWKASIPNVIDDDTLTIWLGPTALDDWLEIDVGTLTAIAGCRIFWDTCPSDYSIEVSADRSSWETLASFTSAAPGSAWKEYTLSTRLVRFIRVRLDAAVTNFDVGEFHYYSELADRVACEHGHGSGLTPSGIVPSKDKMEKGDTLKQQIDLDIADFQKHANLQKAVRVIRELRELVEFIK